MKTESLKNEIIEWITTTQNNSLLKILKSIKDSNANTSADWYDELSDEEISSIYRGIENHRKNEVLNSKEFWSGYGGNLKLYGPKNPKCNLIKFFNT